jgi:hypothetical protein
VEVLLDMPNWLLTKWLMLFWSRKMFICGNETITDHFSLIIIRDVIFFLSGIAFFLCRCHWIKLIRCQTHIWKLSFVGSWVQGLKAILRIAYSNKKTAFNLSIKVNQAAFSAVIFPNCFARHRRCFKMKGLIVKKVGIIDPGQTFFALLQN